MYIGLPPSQPNIQKHPGGLLQIAQSDPQSEDGALSKNYDLSVTKIPKGKGQGRRNDSEDNFEIQTTLFSLRNQ